MKGKQMRIAIILAASSFATATIAQTYEGDVCIDDCSGHRAGYEWALENGISDATDCTGNSTSFDEGCQAYIENPYRDDTSVDDDGNTVSD